MTPLTILSIIVFPLLTLLTVSIIPVYASTAAPSSEQPKPGSLIIITFENGTTKVVRSTSTNVLPVTGGYLIVDPSVVPNQPLPAKTISQNVVTQINTAISIVYSIISPPSLPPPITPPPTNCPAGTELNAATGECEPIECGEGEILQGNDCVPGFQPCGPEWGNPCPDTEPEPTPEPVAPQPEPEPDSQPEPAPDPGNEDQNDGEGEGDNGNGNEEGSSNEDNSGGGGDGSEGEDGDGGDGNEGNEVGEE